LHRLKPAARFADTGGYGRENMMIAAGILALVFCAAGFYGAWADYTKSGAKWQERETAKAKAKPPKQTPSDLASYAALQLARRNERAAAAARLDIVLGAVREARTSDDQPIDES
jgi:cytochrome c-type biogenesis protein CcmH/NrfG